MKAMMMMNMFNKNNDDTERIARIAKKFPFLTLPRINIE